MSTSASPSEVAPSNQLVRLPLLLQSVHNGCFTLNPGSFPRYRLRGCLVQVGLVSWLLCEVPFCLVEEHGNTTCIIWHAVRQAAIAAAAAAAAATSAHLRRRRRLSSSLGAGLPCFQSCSVAYLQSSACMHVLAWRAGQPRQKGRCGA